jgi:hypothetical protein
MSWTHLRQPWALLVVAAGTAVAGCGGKAPVAKSAENASEDDSSSKSSDTPEKEATGKGEADAKDGAKGRPMKCGGFDIPDLIALLADPSCELPDGAPAPKERDLKDSLEVTVSTEARVAPGAHTSVRVLFRNKSKTDLPLEFVVDPEARFEFELYTPKGARADKPGGQEPLLPPSVADAPAPDKHIARITIAANGTAGATLGWDAVKTKWASKDKAKGAVPGRGYPREPAGPLPKGKYVLRVVMPLVGVFEGVDHEVSQPRTNLLIGGS